MTQPIHEADRAWKRVHQVLLDPMTELKASARVARRLAAAELQHRIEESYQGRGTAPTTEEIDAKLGPEPAP